MVKHNDVNKLEWTQIVMPSKPCHRISKSAGNVGCSWYAAVPPKRDPKNDNRFVGA